MKNIFLIIISSLILNSCSSNNEFPAGKWLFKSNEGHAYLTINDTLITFAGISYSCDTIAQTHEDISSIDSAYYDSGVWIIILKPNVEVRLEIDLESRTNGYANFYENSKPSSELYGELSIPSNYFPNFDELNQEKKAVQWSHLPIKHDIKILEKRLKQVAIKSELSLKAQNIMNYLDSLEIELINSLDSEYSLECIHRDYKAYRYHASDFLVNEPWNPTDKYFSALTLKNRLIKYYTSLKKKKFAQDLYDFEFLRKTRDEVRPNSETWEIQQFFHVPYDNVILKLRQIKMAIYQIEKYNDFE